jgi:hypothetical protein
MQRPVLHFLWQNCRRTDARTQKKRRKEFYSPVSETLLPCSFLTTAYFSSRLSSSVAAAVFLHSEVLPTVLRDSVLLLLPPCFYIAKCNKRECCCIWLSGPEFQNLDKRTLGLRTSIFGSQDLGFKTSTGARTQRTPGVPGPGPAKTGSSPRSSAAGHERDPVLSDRARSSVCDGPELRHGRTDGQGTLYIRFVLSVWKLTLG